MARVHLEHVKKVYPNGPEAVRDFCLDIADREFVVLVGPSGCGKSTTLRMIAGLEEITSGTISIADRVVNGVAPKDRDIAMVFQNYALYPHMTVYKNMAFALKLRRMPKQRIDEKVRRAARILGIEPLLARKPKQLSGGQRQRVAVGRAIVREPACFLFDEPLSNLDAKLRVEMRAELKRLHLQLQTTTVYVTHDQEEAMTLGDRVVVMKDGDIMQVGSPLDVYRHPRNIFVASFLGTPPMNLLQGKIVSEGRGLFFDEGSQRLPVPDWAAENLRPRAGSAVVLGIRPEAISEQALAHSHHSSLAVQVNVVEPLGERMDMYVSTEHQPHIVARIQAHRDVSAGETMNLHLDMQRAHFFAGEAAAEEGSGENLCLAAEKAGRKLAAEAQL